jgi:hypothetical protein
MSKRLALGTGSSVIVDRCQVCDAAELEQIMFFGYLPPVNQMRPIGQTPFEQPAYPALLLRCRRCQLVQLGLIVDPQILFPPEYPYTSGTTKILRDNFAELSRECRTLIDLGPHDLVVDIGSNDGTLLSNFAAGHRVQGIEPSNAGVLANERKIPTLISFFNAESAAKVRAEQGLAKVITATNVFAHIEDVHAIVESLLSLLADDGMFISESHYWVSLVETLQYDTVYHEHLRYYSLRSLQHLLEMHGLALVHAKRIPTHGGSIRVYASRRGRYPQRESIAQLLDQEQWFDASPDALQGFRERVVGSKLQLHALLWDLKRRGQRVYGIGAPSRASTLVNYVGLDDAILDCVLEVPGSYKIGKYMPGTLIPVREEACLFSEQPENVLLLSWHIADELIPKLKHKGYRGQFIVPLPEPQIVS